MEHTCTVRPGIRTFIHRSSSVRSSSGVGCAGYRPRTDSGRPQLREWTPDWQCKLYIGWDQERSPRAVQLEQGPTMTWWIHGPP